jgi:O-antigen/teichoic acid export membrane protein
VLCLSGLAQSIGTTVGWIYNSQGRTDLLFKWGLFSGVVRWSAVVVGLKWGVLGVAAAYVLSQYLILWYPSWAIPFRLINLRFTEMLRNLAAPFSCALAMGVAVWMLGCYLPSHWPECGRLAGQVSLGILCYALLLHLFKVRAYSEARELVKEIWACRSRRSPPPSSADNNLPRATVSSASSDQ